MGQSKLQVCTFRNLSFTRPEDNLPVQAQAPNLSSNTLSVHHVRSTPFYSSPDKARTALAIVPLVCFLLTYKWLQSLNTLFNDTTAFPQYKSIGCLIYEFFSQTTRGGGAATKIVEEIKSELFVPGGRQCHEHKTSASTNNLFPEKRLVRDRPKCLITIIQTGPKPGSKHYL